MSKTYMILSEDDDVFVELVAKIKKARYEGMDEEILAAALYALTLSAGIDQGIETLEDAPEVSGYMALSALRNQGVQIYNEVLFAAGLPPVQS